MPNHDSLSKLVHLLLDDSLDIDDIAREFLTTPNELAEWSDLPRLRELLAALTSIYKLRADLLVHKARVAAIAALDTIIRSDGLDPEITRRAATTILRYRTSDDPAPPRTGGPPAPRSVPPFPPPPRGTGVPPVPTPSTPPSSTNTPSSRDELPSHAASPPSPHDPPVHGVAPPRSDAELRAPARGTKSSSTQSFDLHVNPPALAASPHPPRNHRAHSPPRIAASNALSSPRALARARSPPTPSSFPSPSTRQPSP